MTRVVAPRTTTMICSNKVDARCARRCWFASAVTKLTWAVKSDPRTCGTGFLSAEKRGRAGHNAGGAAWRGTLSLGAFRCNLGHLIYFPPVVGTRSSEQARPRLTSAELRAVCPCGPAERGGARTLHVATGRAAPWSPFVRGGGGCLDGGDRGERAEEESCSLGDGVAGGHCSARASHGEVWADFCRFRTRRRPRHRRPVHPGARGLCSDHGRLSHSLCSARRLHVG